MNKSILAFAVLGASAAFASAQSPGATDRPLDPVSAPQNACPGCADGTAPGAATGRSGNETAQSDAPAIFTEELAEPSEASRAVRGSDDQARHLLGRQTLIGPAGNFAALAFGNQYALEYLALAGQASSGGAGSASGLAPGGPRRFDSKSQYYGSSARGVTAAAAYGTDGFDGSPASRAWGMTVGVDLGPVTIRAAHQNRHVARIQLYDSAGNNLDAKNSILAANYRLGWGTAYAAYSVNRGWGSSPLFNPDNPYGAGVASTPSTDSRDVLIGVAVPLSRSTTLLASFIHKNDRDLSNRDANQLALGATYAVTRRTDFYAAYSHIQNTGGAGMTFDNVHTRGSSNSAINVGMRHAF